MKKFRTTPLILVEGALSHKDGWIQANDALQNVVPTDPSLYAAHADLVEHHFSTLKDLDIPMSQLSASRFIETLRAPECKMTIKEVQDALIEVRGRFFDELETRGQFFYIPIARAKYFEWSEPFGPSVSKKFPKATEDIQEAGKCFACARYTACVFHLMRVMEQGVQRLGKKLDVQINVHTEPWQVILNHVNGKIKPMNQKSKRTKLLAEITSHLYNVKVAWRNEVMHPKSTYTEDEAEILLEQVGTFMRRLAEAI